MRREEIPAEAAHGVYYQCLLPDHLGKRDFNLQGLAWAKQSSAYKENQTEEIFWTK